MIEEHLYVWRHVLDRVDMEGIDPPLPKYRDQAWCYLLRFDIG